MSSDASDPVGVLDRMTSILEAFGDDDRGLGISELALRAGLPKSTVSRLVSTLARQRYLERDGRQIHLGLRLFELGQLAEQPRELRLAALPVMADLRSATGETVHLAMRDGHEMVCLAVMRGRMPAPPTARIGARLPIHATALGKSVLAFAGASDARDVLTAELTAWTTRTSVDPVRLQRELDGIRRSGLALERDEYAEGVTSVACPVFAPSGSVVAAISLSGNTGQFDADRSAPALRAAAPALTRRLAAGGQSGV
ncbi:MAG: IclR family transcriptional regulator [Microbacterium sp.]